MPRQGSPESAYTISDSEGSEYDSAPRSTSKRRRVVVSKPKRSVKQNGALPDLEDGAACVARPHTKSYHGLEDIEGIQGDLLSWFEDVRGKRGMPWRKRYDPTLSMEEKGQRAYEVSNVEVWCADDLDLGQRGNAPANTGSDSYCILDEMDRQMAYN
ncbi:hypothetical protein BCR39DRAFT_522828, partial [Naematelia encephala]